MRDADLLGFGDLSEQSLTEIFREWCAMEVEPDGLVFDPGSITVVAIRPEDSYGGERVTIRARLGSARIKVQVDVGIGDANSRMRDFFDVHALAARQSFEGAALVRAVRATFERRRTAIPRNVPLALTPAFADVVGKTAQWVAFLAKNRIAGAPEDLTVTIADIARFALPVMQAASRAEGFAGRWAPGGPWG